MKNSIIRLTEIRQGKLGGKKYKTLIYNDENLILSTKMHETMDSVLKSTQKAGLLESIKTIPINFIKEMKYNEKDIAINIKYEDESKLKSLIIALKQKDMKQDVAEEIASMQNLNKTIKTESKVKPVLLKLFGLTAFSALLWYARKNVISGEFQNSSYNGRYSVYGDLLDFIGPNGLTIIGGALIIYIIFVMIKRFVQPAQEIKFG